MLSRIGQFLSNFANYISQKISRLVAWYNSERGAKTIHLVSLVVKVGFILFVYYLVYQSIRIIYAIATTPTDANKILLGVSGLIAFVWLLIRINITGGKLLKRLRIVKREKIDIPLSLWLDRTISSIEQTKVAIVYWDTLKHLAQWSESITLKFILWPLHSLFEPELEANSLEEFSLASNLSTNLRRRYGKDVFWRYMNWGFPLGFIWILVSLIILLPVLSWSTNPVMSLIVFMANYWGQLVTAILNTILFLFELILIFSLCGSFFVGALNATQKRTDLWWNKSLSSLSPQEPQQREYQELKEHLAQKMNELMDTTERINKVNEQLYQREQALAKIRSFEPEDAGSVGILLDMVLEEEHAKKDIKEQQREKRGHLRDVVFLILGVIIPLFLQSDFARSLYAKLLLLLSGS